jgi:hypothetical protein
VNDYEALVAESNPSVPGAHVRLRLLRRGAEMERQRILEVLQNWTVRGTGDYPDGYRDALVAMTRIAKDEKSIKMMYDHAEFLGFADE